MWLKLAAQSLDDQSTLPQRCDPRMYFEVDSGNCVRKCADGYVAIETGFEQGECRRKFFDLHWLKKIIIQSN